MHRGTSLRTIGGGGEIGAPVLATYGSRWLGRAMLCVRVLTVHPLSLFKQERMWVHPQPHHIPPLAQVSRSWGVHRAQRYALSPGEDTSWIWKKVLGLD